MADKPIIVDLTDGAELVINAVPLAGYWGGQHVWGLATNRLGVDESGQLRSETAIVARIRFDNDMAGVLRTMLDQQMKTLDHTGEAAN